MTDGRVHCGHAGQCVPCGKTIFGVLPFPGLACQAFSGCSLASFNSLKIEGGKQYVDGFFWLVCRKQSIALWAKIFQVPMQRQCSRAAQLCHVVGLLSHCLLSVETCASSLLPDRQVTVTEARFAEKMLAAWLWFCIPRLSAGAMHPFCTCECPMFPLCATAAIFLLVVYSSLSWSCHVAVVTAWAFPHISRSFSIVPHYMMFPRWVAQTRQGILCVGCVPSDHLWPHACLGDGTVHVGCSQEHGSVDASRHLICRSTLFV